MDALPWPPRGFPFGSGPTPAMTGLAPGARTQGMSEVDYFEWRNISNQSKVQVLKKTSSR
jgi:hypothetical protein